MQQFKVFLLKISSLLLWKKWLNDQNYCEKEFMCYKKAWKPWSSSVFHLNDKKVGVQTKQKACPGS